MTERQKQMKKQYEEITKNEPEELFEYYNDLVPGYLNIGKYLEEIPNVFDKIVLAQNCCDEETLKKLLSQVQLSEDQQKKYQKLLSKNDELNMTLNFNLLNNKYDFLNPIMDLITTNVNIQERILSLSDEKLELFKKMFSHLQTVTKFPIPYVDNILKRIGESPFEKNKNYYDKLTSDMAELIKNDYPITEKDIETLLYVYNSDFISLPIENLWDVRDFNNIINNWLEEEINTEVRCKENPNLDVLKNDILLKAYGICKNTAENIKKVFDFSNIEITLENKDIIKTYTTIINILNEQDPNILLKVYDEFSKTEELQFDFMQSIVLGQDLKTVFAHELTKETFKTENNDFMMVGDVPVYDAGTDFRMIVTALGAYQANFGNKDNYSDYWNSSKIRSHGNCCSLIANNNMSMAKVRNVILGFSSMDDQMLMAAGTSDLSSSDDSQKLFMDYRSSGNYMSPNDMINNTRSDYNELVFERRDLSENATNFKKNPDYIVFIEEYDDFDEWLEHYKNNENSTNILLKQKQEEEHRWQESLKAAKDFGIPIVKINRERCAKKENEKITNMMNYFINTHDSSVFPEFINQYENNRVGLCEPHIPIQLRYFNNKKMASYLDGIEAVISNIDDITLKTEMLSSYKSAILNEKQKINSVGYLRRNNKQTSSFNIAERLQHIESLEEELRSNLSVDNSLQTHKTI